LSVVGLLAGLSVLPLVDVLPLLAPALLPLLELEPDVFVAVPLVLLLVVVFVELVSLVVLLVVLLELWLDVVVVVPASCVESAPAGSSAGGVAGASAVPVSGATVVASVVVVLSAAAVASVVVPVADAVAAVNPQHAIANAVATRRCRLIKRALRVAGVPALGTEATSDLAGRRDCDDRPRLVDSRWHDNRSSRPANTPLNGAYQPSNALIDALSSSKAA
jgi:hypothetical protein